jgi:ubiquinone/menaquinone biosynthesis C-methylase UbiE
MIGFMKGLDYFTILAPFYDRGHQYDPTKIIQFIKLDKTDTVLDVGGGTGRVARHLSQFASRVVITDRSLAMLRQASGKNGIDIVCSFSEKMPFSDNYFDGEIIVDALHHVEEQKNTISEMWRTLKPGGRILIEEINITKVKGKLIQLMEKLLLMGSHFLLPQEILALFDGYNYDHQIVIDDLTTWIIIKKLV